MAKDYESTTDASDDSNECMGDDFPSLLIKLLGSINLKVAIFIFILGMFIFSDIFIKNILSGFPEGVSDINSPTTYGTTIQLLFLVMGYILLDLLVQGRYI